MSDRICPKCGAKIYHCGWCSNEECDYKGEQTQFEDFTIEEKDSESSKEHTLKSVKLEKLNKELLYLILHEDRMKIFDVKGNWPGNGQYEITIAYDDQEAYKVLVDVPSSHVAITSRIIKNGKTAIKMADSDVQSAYGLRNFVYAFINA